MLLLVALLGCDTEVGTTPAPSRVAAVAAKPVTADDVAAFCEVQHQGPDAPVFAWPALDGVAPPQQGARWVNVWATWCGPCIAETPMIVAWQDKLKAHGVRSDVVFLSVDADAASVERFYAKEKDFPRGPRLADVSLLGPWLTAQGLEAGAAIPLHFLLDAEGRTRCVRAGALSESDYAVVRSLLD